MGNSASTSAKRQAARHAREERKREFEREQEHETRLALERDELLARIRALLDENNIFDPLTDDDRAALARQCRRCVALPGERVMYWRTKRERAVLRQARDAAEAERWIAASAAQVCVARARHSTSSNPVPRALPAPRVLSPATGLLPRAR